MWGNNLLQLSLQSRLPASSSLYRVPEAVLQSSWQNEPYILAALTVCDDPDHHFNDTKICKHATSGWMLSCVRTAGLDCRLGELLITSYTVYGEKETWSKRFRWRRPNGLRASLLGVCGRTCDGRTSACCVRKNWRRNWDMMTRTMGKIDLLTSLASLILLSCVVAKAPQATKITLVAELYESHKLLKLTSTRACASDRIVFDCCFVISRRSTRDIVSQQHQKPTKLKPFTPKINKAKADNGKNQQS